MVPGIYQVTDGVVPENSDDRFPEEAVVGGVGDHIKLIQAVGLELRIGDEAEDSRNHNGYPKAGDDASDEHGDGILPTYVGCPEPLFSETHGGLLRKF